MILLDTDHMTVLFFRDDTQYESLSERLLTSDDSDIGTTVISLEEQMRGWLSEIARRRRIHDLIPVYEKLTGLVEFYSRWDVAPFDLAAADNYERLKKLKGRIGAQDLKIASIALAMDALLLSSNLVHFEQVPGLKVEDWRYSPLS